MSLRSKVNKFFDNSPLLAIIAALCGSSFIALSPLFVRYSEVGTTATAFYRFFFALPIVWTWMIFDNVKDQQHRSPRSIREYVILMGAGLFLGFDISFWHLSMIHTSIVNAVLLNALTPVLVAFAAWAIFREKITVPIGIGIFLSLMGSFVLVTASPGDESSTLLGDAYALTSAVFYAGFMICMKELRKSFSTPTIMFWVALVGMYFLAVNSYFMDEVMVAKTSSGWLLLVSMTLIVHILGGGLLAYSMGHLSATFSSLTILVGPFVAAIIGFVFFGELLSIQQTVGGIIVVIGIVISRQTSLTLKRKPPHNILH